VKNELYRLLARNLPNSAVLIFDHDLRYLLADGPVLGHQGLAKELVEGRTLWDIAPPEEVDDMAAYYQATLRGEEVVLEQASGDHLYEVRLSPIYEDGEITAGIIIIQEVTERHREQERIRQSEERYRGMVESQQDLIARTTPGGRFTFVNDAFCGKFGMTRAELIDLPFDQLVHPDDLPHTRDNFRRLTEPPYRRQSEARAKTAQGWRWMAWEGYGIRDKAGNVIEIQTVGRDINDRREAERALQESEAQLELFFSHGLDGYFLLELDEPLDWGAAQTEADQEARLDHLFANLRVTRFNEALLKQLDLSAEALRGQTPNQLFANRLATARRRWRELLDAGKLRVDVEIPRPDGSQLVVAATYIAIFDEQQRFKGNYGIYRDITEQRAYEQALHESEARYRAIVEDQTELICRFKPDGTLTFVNQAYASYFGKTSDQLLGTSFTPLIPPEDQDKIAEVLAQITLEHPASTIEHRVRLPDGTLRWHQWTNRAIYDDNGQIVQFQAVGRDVTDRIEAQRELQNITDQLSLMVERLPVVPHTTEAGGTFATRYMGPSIEAITGYRPEQFTEDKRFWMDRLHPDDRARVFANLHVLLEKGQMQHEYRWRIADGSYKWFADMLRLVKKPDGSNSHIIGAWHDITERKHDEAMIAELNADLRRRAAQLEATNKELEAFTYSVSHDLRAPLRAMDGFSRILIEDFQSDLPEEAQHYLDRVRANAQKMGELVDDLLSLSRLGRAPLNMQTVQPAEVVQAVLEELDSGAAHIQIDDLPPCKADRGLLTQVYTNLLANAIKFSREQAKPCIEVGSRQNGQEVVYFVRDNGAGFDMRYANKLFGVFQRLHDARDYEGTGVGLATVQRIIHRHGGRIWAESEVDQGATFFFTLEKDGET
jgi:PAS domain S-box-containing protein